MARSAFPRKANNAGLVPTTVVATGNLCHTLPIGRSARITKIHAYNPTGGPVTLQFGTWDRNPAGAAFVALMPILVALATLDNEWLEREIPPVEWQNNTTPTALAGRTGNIYVVANAATVVISLEIEEFGA